MDLGSTFGYDRFAQALIALLGSYVINAAMEMIVIVPPKVLIEVVRPLSTIQKTTRIVTSAIQRHQRYAMGPV